MKIDPVMLVYASAWLTLFTATAQCAADGLPGALNPAFQPPVLLPDEAAYTMGWQTDGKILVGGAALTRASGAHLYRHNADGSRDTTFASPELPIGAIYDILVGDQPLPPPLTASALRPGGFEFRLPTLSNFVYRVQRSDPTGQIRWINLKDFPGNGNWQALTDTNQIPAAAFYRVQVIPVPP